MKRLAFFLASLVIMFLITFALSLLFFPDWVTQTGWLQKLTITIIIAGLVAVASEFISQILAFMFDDKEFRERLSFIAGDKYERISKRLDEFTHLEIGKEKKSRKYIPNIFVETTEIKEKLRYFSEPFIFFPKIAEQTERNLHSSYIFNALKQVHFPVTESHYPNIRLKVGNQKSLLDEIQRYRNYLDEKLTLTDVLIKERGTGIKPEYKSRIPLKYSHIYEYIYPTLQFYRLYESDIEDTKKDIALLKSNAVIIKSLAGHGKTNLLCDFAERFLIKKGHKVLYISAKTLNHLGEQETLEQAIVRTLFTDADFQFSDILRLVKFDKKIDYLYILIDGINEQKNPALFSTALEQFIQKCSKHKIKIVLTCRSEYFDCRFGNLLHVDNLSLLDIDEPTYINDIPEVHQNALVSRYFSEFKIYMSPNFISVSVIETFFRDKLLLRIFCEAYENERPAGYLGDLYKLEIFNKYFEKKIGAIDGLENCLDEIISWMIENNEFVNIRISYFSKATVELIEAITYENVIIKKDIVAFPGLAFGRFEVANFVYDEFRDFLIASKVIIEWERNNPKAQEMIQNLAIKGSSVAEGLQKYLCLWSIKNQKNNLIEHLSSQDWFGRVFIEAVFDTPDTLLTSYAIHLLENLFIASPENTRRMIWHFTQRANINNHPILNIELLFNYLNKFSDNKYKKFIADPLLEEYNFRGTHISYLCSKIIDAFKEKKVQDASRKNIIKLLGYFSGIEDYSSHLRKNKWVDQPAIDALFEIAEEIGEFPVQDAIHEVIANAGAKLIKSYLRSFLRQLGEK